MTLSEFERMRVERILDHHCETLVPPEHRATRRLGYRVQGNRVTLIEEVASEDGGERWSQRPAVQFRFNSQERTWAVYVMDELGSWTPHPSIEESDLLEDLLEQVQGTPTAILWD